MLRIVQHRFAVRRVTFAFWLCLGEDCLACCASAQRSASGGEVGGEGTFDDGGVGELNASRCDESS